MLVRKLLSNTPRALSLALAGVLWTSGLHFFYRPASSEASALAVGQMRDWDSAAAHARETKRMREVNAEWDFMNRTFLVLAYCNMAIASPASQPMYLAAVDDIIEDTLAVEEARGGYSFMMPYVAAASFKGSSGRSVFIDGELALMMAARQIVERKPEYEPLLRDRAAAITTALSESPTASGESYPDECWTFCNTTALAALTLFDLLTHEDHHRPIEAWLAFAKAHLIEPETGLLASSYTYDGQVKDGPEGSSLWMSAHNLIVVDEKFANEQYRTARRTLGKQVLGFGYAQEWPRESHAPHARMADVDSGPIVPLFEASAGSSGLALLGARAFHDSAYFEALRTSLHFAGFPDESDGALHYAAGSGVGDAVILYSMVEGPLWDRVKSLRKKGGES